MSDRVVKIPKRHRKNRLLAFAAQRDEVGIRHFPTTAMTGARARVLTFNIRYDTPQDGKDQWIHRRESVLARLQASQADIIGIQEALLPQRDYLAQHLSEYTPIGVARDDGHNAGEFNPIFFRHDRFCALDSGTFWLSATPYQPGTKVPSSSLPRICSWARLQDRQTPQSIFAVFNIHLDHYSGDARVQQVEILLQQIQCIAGLYPSVLMGDFNCTSAAKPYKSVAGSFYMDSRELLDSKDIINGHLRSFTGFYEPTENPPLGDATIDHIFVSGFDVLHWELDTMSTPNGRALSDHRAIYVDLVNQYA